MGLWHLGQLYQIQDHQVRFYDAVKHFLQLLHEVVISSDSWPGSTRAYLENMIQVLNCLEIFTVIPLS